MRARSATGRRAARTSGGRSRRRRARWATLSDGRQAAQLDRAAFGREWERRATRRRPAVLLQQLDERGRVARVLGRGRMVAAVAAGEAASVVERGARGRMARHSALVVRRARRRDGRRRAARHPPHARDALPRGRLRDAAARRRQPRGGRGALGAPTGGRAEPGWSTGVLQHVDAGLAGTIHAGALKASEHNLDAAARAQTAQLAYVRSVNARTRASADRCGCRRARGATARAARTRTAPRRTSARCSTRRTASLRGAAPRVRFGGRARLGRATQAARRARGGGPPPPPRRCSRPRSGTAARRRPAAQFGYAPSAGGPPAYAAGPRPAAAAPRCAPGRAVSLGDVRPMTSDGRLGAPSARCSRCPGAASAPAALRRRAR